MKLRLSYDVEPGGWATLRLWDERGDVTIVASYLHDSLLELVEAASVLAAGAQSAEVTFVEEPSHVVLYLGPVVGGEVPLVLVRYPDWPERHEGQGEVVLRTRAPTDRFVRQVLAAAELVRAGIGEAEYHQRWREAPFPTEPVQRLRARIGGVG